MGEFDPFVPLDIKDETCAELAMNWQFTLFKPVFVLAFRLKLLVGDDGDGGVVRSDKDADIGIITHV